MRLSLEEKSSIESVLRAADPAAVVRLFGSRADDSKRGGDIDILFETTRAMQLKDRLLLQYRVSAACDVQVDLLIKTPEDEETPIIKIARNGILL